MADLVLEDLVLAVADGWSAVPARTGVEDLHLAVTCPCGSTVESAVDAAQRGPGQHAADVTCSGCGAVEQVVWRTEEAD